MFKAKAVMQCNFKKKRKDKKEKTNQLGYVRRARRRKVEMTILLVKINEEIKAYNIKGKTERAIASKWQIYLTCCGYYMVCMFMKIILCSRCIADNESSQVMTIK